MSVKSVIKCWELAFNRIYRRSSKLQALWVQCVTWRWFFLKTSRNCVTVTGEWWRKIVMQYLWFEPTTIDINNTFFFHQDTAMCYRTHEKTILLQHRYPGRVITKTARLSSRSCDLISLVIISLSTIWFLIKFLFIWCRYDF